MVYHHSGLETWGTFESRDTFVTLIDTQVWRKFADSLGLSYGNSVRWNVFCLTPSNTPSKICNNISAMTSSVNCDFIHVCLIV